MLDQHLQKHIVVITDDSVAERRMFKESVAKSSESSLNLYEAGTAADLYCLFDRLVCRGEFPSLIILDFVLGTDNGLSVAQVLRRKYPPVPIVVFGSCLGSAEFITNLYRIGVNAYIVKPQTASGYTKIMQQVADVWLHNPQPIWISNEEYASSPDRTLYGRRVSDRRQHNRRSE